MAIILLATTTALSSCASKKTTLFKNQDFSIKAIKKIKSIRQNFIIEVDKPPVAQDPSLLKEVTLFAKKITLAEAIMLVGEKIQVFSGDPEVDLDKKITVNYPKNSFSGFLKYLSGLTGYNLVLEGDSLTIYSKLKKIWHLTALSVESDTVKGDRISLAKSEDHWKAIIENIEKIIGKDSVLVSDKRTGIVTAIASVKKINEADYYIQAIKKSSSRLVELRVQIIDVTVDDQKGNGIDWSLISNQSSKGGIESVNVGVDNDGIAGGISIGTLGGGAIDLGKNITLEFMLQFLEKQGKVKVTNQPIVTVVNGQEAFISTGDEFSYVASLESVPDLNGNVITTSVVARTKVGVEMKVAPKILENGLIILSIVPIVSSVKSFTTLSSGHNQEFRTPNVALQQLSTQVIVKNGGTAHLGGLIAKKISQDNKGVGASSGGAWLNNIFGSNVAAEENREIIILVTATEVVLDVR